MMRYCLCFWIAALLAVGLAGPAHAHANLVRANPPAGASLDRAPQTLELEFSEELDPSFSRVQLFNSRHELVATGPATVDAANPLIMRLPLGDLPADSYTAVWRALSVVDGHETEGSLPFGVGVARVSTSALPPVGAPDPALVPAPWADAALRWLQFVGLALALGGLPFFLLVWRPAGSAPGADPAAERVMLAGLRWLALAGAALVIAANLAMLVVWSARSAQVPPLAALGGPLWVYAGGRIGLAIVARSALLLVLAGLAWRGLRGSPRPWVWRSMLAAGGLALLTISLTSHAAAQPQAALALVAVDWLHLAGTVVWGGGLAGLALALGLSRRSPSAPTAARLLPRFSRLAGASVAVLALSGALSSWLHVGGLELLLGTTYGRALLIKLGVFGGLLALAAINLLLLAPRLRGGSAVARRWLARTIGLELALIGAVLLIAGILTSVAPSRAAWEARRQLGIVETASQSGVTLRLWITPGRTGDNQIAVDVADRRPGADATAGEVILRLGMEGMDMAAVEVPAGTLDQRRYIAGGSLLSMSGMWTVEVVLRRPGFDDIRHTFPIVVRSPDPLAGQG